MLAEAARLLRPGGRLIVVDLAGASAGPRWLERLAHRWPGFGDETMQRWLAVAGLLPGQKLAVTGRAASAGAHLARHPQRSGRGRHASPN